MTVPMEPAMCTVTLLTLLKYKESVRTCRDLSIVNVLMGTGGTARVPIAKVCFVVFIMLILLFKHAYIKVRLFVLLYILLIILLSGTYFWRKENQKLHKSNDYLYTLLCPIDIDECVSDMPPCEHVCRNTNGGYQCTCEAGFEKMVDQKGCQGL